VGVQDEQETKNTSVQTVVGVQDEQETKNQNYAILASQSNTGGSKVILMGLQPPL